MRYGHHSETILGGIEKNDMKGETENKKQQKIKTCQTIDRPIDQPLQFEATAASNKANTLNTSCKVKNQTDAIYFVVVVGVDIFLVSIIIIQFVRRSIISLKSSSSNSIFEVLTV